jgi:transcriptional regulator with XRE-family HTH domain
MIFKNPNTAGKKLGQLRIKYGLTFDVLASGSGISKPALIEIEKGRSIPFAKTLFKLNQYFGELEDGEGS